MCLKYVSLQLYTLQLKRRWGVSLAATPKDCHKPINTTPAPTSPPTQMMSAFIRRVVIPPLVGCEAAAVPLFVSAPKARKTPSLHWLPTALAPLVTRRTGRYIQKLPCVLHAHAHLVNSGTAFCCKTPNAEMQHLPHTGKLSPCCSCYGYIQDFTRAPYLYTQVTFSSTL